MTKEKTKTCPHCGEENLLNNQRCKKCKITLSGQKEWSLPAKVGLGTAGALLLFIIIGTSAGCTLNDASKQSSTTSTPQATQQQKPAGKVEVKSHTPKNEYGYPSIVGEVVNNTGQPVSFVKVTATFYDAAGKVVATNFTYAGDTAGTPLQPGATTPFEITDSSKSNYSNYKLDVTWQ